MSKTITGAMPIRTVGLTPGHRWCGGLRSVKPAVNNGKGAPGLVHGPNSLNASYIRPGRISDRPRKLAKDLRNGHLGGEAEPGASPTIGLAHGTLEANVVTRQVVHTLPPQQEPVNAVAFSPDGKLLAIGTGDWRTENPGEVELWDPASGKHISNAWHSPRDVKALAFAPDGKRLAIAHAAARTAGGAGAVAIVGVLTSAPGGSLSCPTGATARGLSPDGRIVAAGQWNGKIRLWDADTLTPLISRPIPAHGDMISTWPSLPTASTSPRRARTGRSRCERSLL